MRAVFFGSPDFAVPILQALASRSTVAAAVTQPDRPAGRGRALRPPAVKSACAELGIPVLQPVNPNQPDLVRSIKRHQPDLIVVAAYGRILRSQLLDLPPYGCLNVHASLLPRWRGAAPIAAAILAGDPKTGTTLMRMDPGMDTGPILAQAVLPIRPEETAGELSARLSALGARLLMESLPAYLDGALLDRPQDPALATYAPLLKKSDGQLDFTRSPYELERMVRAYEPWPGAHFTSGGQRIRVLRAQALDIPTLALGQPESLDGVPVIGCGSGCLRLDQVQLAGRKPVSGADFLRGHPGFLKNPIDLTPATSSAS
jgi:methionyl-tRNA formyltransferase